LSQTDDIDSKLQVVKLNSQDLSHFDCTDKGEDAQGLQIFIQKEAREYQQRDLGVTYLSLLGNIIAGFLTVAMSSVDVERMERGERVMGVPFDTYPALMIGRLAVDRRFRKKGIGSYLCSWCLGLARDLSKQLGCRYVVLHAREEVIPFYDRNHFVLSEAEKNKPTKLLYRKISSLKQQYPNQMNSNISAHKTEK